MEGKNARGGGGGGEGDGIFTFDYKGDVPRK